MTEQQDTLDLLKQYGLFLSSLNSGEWVSGPANHIYLISIMDDHYTDPMLRVRPTPQEAVAAAVELRREMRE